MKKLYKSLATQSRWLCAIALVTIIGFTFAACGDGGGGGGGSTRDAKTYTGTAASGVTYTLKIEDGGSRAVLTPTKGDKYTLTQTANTQKSTGTVTKVVGGELTLAPQEDPDDEFTATVSGNGIIAMSGNITWDDGTANEAPVTLTTPSTGGGNSDWKWTAVADSTIWEYTSSGGVTYTSVINAIAYGNNRFVAVGWYGRMAYSSDGASWTAVANSKIWDYTIGGESGTDIINAVTYGNNRFVAVGGSHIAYSDNGASWTAVSSTNSPFNEYDVIYAIAYGNNRFVVGDRDGNIAYSANGASWTAVSTNGASWVASWNNIFGGYTINAIAYGNNRFVAGGDGGKMAYADW
jgi:hypothetical protein